MPKTGAGGPSIVVETAAIAPGRESVPGIAVEAAIATTTSAMPGARSEN